MDTKKQHLNLNFKWRDFMKRLKLRLTLLVTSIVLLVGSSIPVTAAPYGSTERPWRNPEKYQPRRRPAPPKPIAPPEVAIKEIKGGVIAANTKITKGTDLFSQNEKYKLSFHQDGSLVIYEKNGRRWIPQWKNSSVGKDAEYYRVGNDGTFRICVKNEKTNQYYVKFMSNTKNPTFKPKILPNMYQGRDQRATQPTKYSNYKLVLSNNGYLDIIGDVTIWSNTPVELYGKYKAYANVKMYPNQIMYSPAVGNVTYGLTLNKSNNKLEYVKIISRNYRTLRTVLNSFDNKTCSYVAMQTTGELVSFNDKNQSVWNSGTLVYTEAGNGIMNPQLRLYNIPREYSQGRFNQPIGVLKIKASISIIKNNFGGINIQNDLPMKNKVMGFSKV
jgi:hypothetical protein